MDLTPLYAALVAGAVAVIGALVTYLTAKLKKATTKEEVEELKIKQQSLEKDLKKVEIQAALKHYYTKCQNCGNEIDLSTADIYTKNDDGEEVHDDNN